MSPAESAFYEAAAKRFAASTAIYHVRSVVHFLFSQKLIPILKNFLNFHVSNTKSLSLHPK